MLPPCNFYWFRIDNKHMNKPWLDQALMDQHTIVVLTLSLEFALLTYRYRSPHSFWVTVYQYFSTWVNGLKMQFHLILHYRGTCLINNSILYKFVWLRMNKIFFLSFSYRTFLVLSMLSLQQGLAEENDNINRWTCLSVLKLFITLGHFLPWCSLQTWNY